MLASIVILLHIVSVHLFIQPTFITCLKVRCMEIRDKDFIPVIKEFTIQLETETSKEINTIHK